MNQRLAKKKDPNANLWADRVAECFDRDSLLQKEYHTMNGGKWNHMMDEIYIGYKSWATPKTRVMPAVTRVAGSPTGKLAFPTPLPASAKVSSSKGKCEFEERNGYISIEAEHFTRKIDGKEAKWTVIPELGRTLSAVTPQPVTASVEGMALEYDIDVTSEDYPRVKLRFSPTLNFHVKGLRYAISIDGKEEKVVDVNGNYKGELGPWQREGIIECETIHPKLKPGRHTLYIRPLDNGLVLQKIMIDFGGMHRSFLGAPETIK